MIKKLGVSFSLLFLLIGTKTATAQNADSLKNSLLHLPERPKDDIYDTLRCKILDQLGEISEGEAWRNYSEQLKELCEIRLKKIGKNSELKNFYYHYLGSAYSGLGSCNYENGDIILAIEQWQNGLNYYEAARDTIGIATIVNNLGVSYMGLGELDKCLEFFNKSYKLAQKNASKADLAQIVNNIGFIYMKKNLLDTALHYYKKGQALSEESGSNYSLAESINHIGFAYKLKGQLSEALIYYQKSLAIREKINDQKGISNSLNNLANCYIELKQFDAALTNAKRSLEIGKTLGNVERIRQAAFSLKTIHENTGHYKDALKMYELYIQMRDSTMNESTRNEGLKKNLKYEFEKRELLLKEEQTRREALKDQKRTYYTSFTLILLLLLGLLFYSLYARYKHKKEKEQQDLLLRIKDSEIKALQLQMNPHFIFNSLNSVLEFISRSETNEAIKYLTKFSRLIRLVLEFSNRKNIFLSEEIELLGLYIDLENIRSEKGFNVHLTLEEGLDPKNYEIHPMLIQPFVENSIIHGIQNKVKISETEKTHYKGELNIHFSMSGEFLKCVIEDNGIGREQAVIIKNSKSFNHLSLGMHITRERLDLISQRVSKIDYFDLKDKNNMATGTRVEILIPLLQSF